MSPFRFCAVVLVLAAACTRSPQPATSPPSGAHPPAARPVERVLLDGFPVRIGDNNACKLSARRLLDVDVQAGTVAFLGRTEDHGMLLAMTIPSGTPRLIAKAEAGEQLCDPEVLADGSVAWVHHARDGGSSVRVLLSGDSLPKVVADDRGRKSMLRSMGSLLFWHQTRCEFAGSSDEIVMGDLRSGKSRRLGPPAQESEYLLHPSGRWLATLAEDEEDCRSCRYLGRYRIARIFDLPSGEERLKLEGDMASIAWSPDPGELLILPSGHIIDRDGKRLQPDVPPRWSDRSTWYTHRLNAESLAMEKLVTARAAGMPLLSVGWFSFDEDERALSLFDTKGRVQEVIRDVIAAVASSDLAGMYFMQEREGKLRIVERRWETPHSVSVMPMPKAPSLPLVRTDPLQGEMAPRPPLATCAAQGGASTLIEVPGRVGLEGSQPNHVRWQLGPKGPAVAFVAQDASFFMWQQGGDLEMLRLPPGKKASPKRDGSKTDAGDFPPHSSPGIVRLPAGVVGSWFDGGEVQVAYLEQGKLIGKRGTGVAAAAELRRHGDTAALVWPVGADVRVQLLDGRDLHTRGAAASMAAALPSSEDERGDTQPPPFALASEGDRLRVFVETKASCGRSQPRGCVELVELGLDDNGSFTEPRGLEPPHPDGQGGGPLVGLASYAGGEVMIHNDSLRFGTLVRPSLEEGLVDARARDWLAASGRGLAVVSRQTLLRGSPIALILTDREGNPRCASPVREQDRVVISAQANADDTGVDLYYLTNNPGDRRATIQLKHQRYSWP